MVEFETRGRVAVLTINRPEARNAVNGEVAQSMEAGIDRLEDDSELWAGVVAAVGPVFSAGEGDDVGWRLTEEAFGEIIRSEDFAEGPRAFVEKRAPEWKGR